MTDKTLLDDLRSRLHGHAPDLHDGDATKAKCVICGNFNRFWYVVDACNFCQSCVSEAIGLRIESPLAIPMLLWCPSCGDRHIDVGEFATKVHHTHACQSCGMVWRPAIVPTIGVQWLQGFKNDR